MTAALSLAWDLARAFLKVGSFPHEEADSGPREAALLTSVAIVSNAFTRSRLNSSIACQLIEFGLKLQRVIGLFFEWA